MDENPTDGPAPKKTPRSDVGGPKGRPMVHRRPNLNSILFYSDLDYLLETGHTITGHQYLARPEGPLVTRYTRGLVSYLYRAGMGGQVMLATEKGAQVLSSQKPFCSKVDLINKYTSLLANKTTAELSRYAHQNAGWLKGAQEGFMVGKPLRPINMNLAIQQLDDHDWTAPFNDTPTDK